MSNLFKLNLQFNSESEKEFQNEFTEKSGTVIKIGLLLGIFLYMAFGVLDAWILPDSKLIAWSIRLSVIIPALFIAFLLPKIPRIKKHHQYIMSVVSLAAGFGVNAIIAVSYPHELGNKYYFIGIILVIIWAHTFFKLRYVFSTIVSILITLGYEFIAIFSQHLLKDGLLPIFIINNFFLITANIIGIFASYNLELLSRQNFLQRKKTEFENEKNKEKNREIYKQKEEIILKSNELLQQKEEMKVQANKLSQVNKELEQLSIVTKKTDNAILIADINGHIEWVNDGFVRLYGYNIDQLFLFKGNNLLNISDSLLLKDVIQNGFKGRDAIIYETRTTTKFGECIWIQTTLTPVFNEKKEIIKLVAIDSNINKLKLAEAEIIKQNAEIEQKTIDLIKQKEISEHSNSNMEILNIIGQRIISSLEVEKIVETVYNSINAMMDASVFVIASYNAGKNRLDSISAIEKDITLPFFSWDINDDHRLAVWCFKNQKAVFINNYPDEALSLIEKPLPPIIGETTASVIYYPLIVLDKTIGVLSVQSFSRNAYTEYHLNIIKNLALYVSIALENANVYKQIIKQKNHIEKANAELEKLSIVASKTDNAVIIADPSGVIEWVNEGFTKIYGYNLDQLCIFLGKNLLNISSSPVLKEVIKDGFKDRDAVIYENLSTTKFGQKIWVQTTLTPILNENKKVVKLVAIDTNINKRKLAEDEIVKQKEELEVQHNFVMRQGDKIATQNVKIKQQRDLVVKQKKEITDSIHYAQRIQSAILPNNEQLNRTFRDFFVFFKPKDIVSGDFYWVYKQNDLTFFAAVDCTGHGVPGAFMSMLGISYFNEIVIEKGITKPAEILFRLRNTIISTLHQTGEVGESKDGMDVSLCVLNHTSKQLQYSGANNPLYLVRNTKQNQPFIIGKTYKIQIDGADQEYTLTTLKADKMPIGVHIKDSHPFTNHVIQLKENDNIYVFSDGFIDQFGGEKQKKFLSKQFRDLLLQIQPLNMNDQKALINQTFENWKGSLEQIDDVLIIGVKV